MGKLKNSMGTRYSWWDSWYSMLDSYDSKFGERINRAEEIRKFKAMVNEVANEEFMPLRVNVSPIYKSPQFMRGTSRYSISMNSDDMISFNDRDKIREVIRLMDKLLPEKSHQVHSSWVDALYHDDKFCLKDCMDRTGAFYELKKVPFSYDNVIKYFYLVDESGTPNVGGTSTNQFEGGGTVGQYVQLPSTELYKETLKKLGKYFVRQAKSIMVESTRSGKRINPKFISGMSNKPLLDKLISSVKKPKVMIIHDCSGSMGSGRYEDEPAFKAVSFIGALVQSGVVDVSHVVYHSEHGWRDMVKQFKSGELAHMTGCADGFIYLDDNIPQDWVKDVDFVIVTTDLEYDDEGKKGLLSYMGKAPRHMVLSFSDNPSIPGLLSRKVSDIKDMVSAIGSILKGN